MKVSLKRIVAFTLICVLTISSLPDIRAQAKAPAYKCAKTDKNLMKLMKTYDKDAYYILKKQKEKGDTFTAWMTNGKYLADCVDTAVHEEFHGYTSSYANFDFTGLEYAFYIGGKKTIMVPRTDGYGSIF